MKDTVHQRFTQTAAALFALALVLSVFSPIGTVAAVDGITVSQQADSTTVTPGDTITFTTDVSVDEAQIEANSIGLQTELPDGWEITRQDGEFFGTGPDGWLWFTTTGVSGSDTVQYTVEVPDDAESGDYDISVTASTEDGESTTDTTTITVAADDEPENEPPTADAGDDQTVEEGDEVTLDASGSDDPDGDDLSYEWTQTDGTDVTLSEDDTATPTFTAPSVDSETTLTFEVGVSDGEETDTDEVSVTVQPAQPANEAPTIDAIDDQTVTEGDSETVSVNADDPDGDSVSLSVSGPDFVTLDGDTITIAPESGDAGTYAVDVTADDGTDQTTESFQLTVEEPAGPAMSVSQSADQTTVQPGDTITFTTDVSVDGDQVDANSVGLETELPDGWEITRQDGEFFGTGPDGWLWFSSTGVSGSDTVQYTVEVPDDAESGDYDVSVTASTEGEGGVSATDETTITVEQPTNTPPTIDAVDDQTVTEGDSETVSVNADDPDGDSVSLSLSEAPDFATLSDDEITLAPESGDAGTYTVEVTADDGNGGTATESFQVTVEEPPNQPPTIDAIDDQTVTEGDSATVPVNADDPDGDSVSLSITGPDFVSLSNGELTIAPESGDAGTYTVDVSADDGTDQTTESFQLIVEEPPNQPPSADAGDDQTVEEGDTVTLDASDSNDPDGDDLSYSWTQTAGPDVTLDDTSSATPTFTAPDVDADETLTFEVEVSDGEDSDTDDVDVTVEDAEPENEPPEAAFDASPTDPEVGEDVTFDASASEDSDGSIESYEWDFGDGETTTGEEVTHAFDDAGEYEVTLEVEDDDGATDSVTETITVSEVPNEDPTAAFDVSPAAPEVGEDVTLDASDSDDPDGEIDSYEWMITPPGGESEATLLDSDFEEGSLSEAGWTPDAIEDSAGAGVSDATSNSGSYSAYHLGGEGALVSDELDASGADAVEVSYWIQKGSEEFSENPDADAGEDMVVEYLDAEGNWVEVDRVEDTVDPGAETTETLTLSEDALHDGLQIRFRQQGASFSEGDYWHVDDVSVTAMSTGAEPMTMTGETATFTPSTAGDYDVSLTVTDDDGATDSTTQTITASDADDELSILEAVAGEDGEFSTTEIQQAIDLWVEDEPVPNTGGKTIDTQTMQQLIDAWAEDESVSEIGGDA